MNILTGICNFLQFINDNWTMMITIVILIAAIAKKIFDFLDSSEEEKIAIAKEQIQETMLKLVTTAETDYMQWVSAGAIKRSQVIEEIFKKYPVLSKVADQEDLVEWIDITIDEALEEMRKIFTAQTEDKSVVKER